MKAKTTMMYIEKIRFKNDDFETTAATTLEEVNKLGKLTSTNTND